MVMKNFKYVCVMLSIVLMCGCATDYSKNNVLDLGFIIKQFQDCGFTILNPKPLILPENLYAHSAIAIEIDGVEIGVYKFDTRNKKALKTLTRIDNLGYMYIMAIKKLAIVNGSFVMMNYDQYRDKDKREKIINAFTSMDMSVVTKKLKN